MGKSIRSKIRRKHRSEFRNTVGKVAYDEKQRITLSKLKECIEKPTLRSIDKLSDALNTNMEHVPSALSEANMDHVRFAHSEDLNTMVMDGPAARPSGENKVIVSKRSKRNQKYSYKLRAVERDKQPDFKDEARLKKKPKFFCQF